MERGPTGEYKIKKTGEETVKAFLPFPLPPDPSLEITPDLRAAIDQATLSLGRLDGIMIALPETSILLYMYVRKEAVLSSQIEGTQSSLDQLLLFEIDEYPGVPPDEVTEVSNYVAALDHSLKRLKEDFPFSNRLIREIHGILLKGGRGSDKEPGEFRRSQNWIGGSRPGNAVYVPPPPEFVESCMFDLEKFLNNIPERSPALIKSALSHVQFESIHPFLDGNGRVGRLLIPLLLCHEGILKEPLLYLSLYFKQNRSVYYDLLMKVRRTGNWEDWVLFFCEGVKHTADGALSTAQRLLDVAGQNRIRIQRMGRIAGSALRVHEALQKRPLGSIRILSKETKLSAPAVTGALMKLEKEGIVKEISGRKRNRIFAYEKYLEIIRQGTV
jgi:Fic family protein